MPELRKYLIRFGLIVLIALPIMLLTQGENALKIIGYKVCLVAIAVGLAELLWAVFFKPIYGKTEALADVEKLSIMLFRGMLYAAVILALTLGL